MRIVLALAVALAGVAGCADDDEPSSAGPTVVVTTTILGDVVGQLVGDHAQVEVLMPPNVDPHDFAPSAKQAAAIREADVVVQNGLGFEAGLDDTITAAAGDGVTVITASDAIDPIPFGADGEDDPHLFTDPRRMADAAAFIAEELATAVPALDDPAVAAGAAAYVADLRSLDAEVEALLAGIPTDQRVLVTNHEVFGYFADRYDFEVLGSVIPGGSTLAEPAAGDLADLIDAIEERGVAAIFVDTSSPARLAESLAAEGAAVEVVALYSESLGEPGSSADTYAGMVRTNAERIVAALT